MNNPRASRTSDPPGRGRGPSSAPTPSRPTLEPPRAPPGRADHRRSRSASTRCPGPGGPCAFDDWTRRVFVISVAAQLAGMHAQTLRSYDREGLVSPDGPPVAGRRYSRGTSALLREVQRLCQDDGVNLCGIRRILQLESQVDALRARLAEVTDAVAELRAELAQSRMDAANAAANAIAGLRRDVVPWQEPTTALVTWRRSRRG